MDNKKIKEISQAARRYMDEGYHCSESVLLAAGAHYLGKVDPLAMRMSTPFAGGLGGSHEELCGALAGGILLIGALYGRTDVQTNDDQCQALAAQWRMRFLEDFGYTRCQDLREQWVGQPGQVDCKDLVARATGLLVDLLEEAG